MRALFQQRPQLVLTLNALLARLGVRQRRRARLFGVSQSAVSQWQRGISRPGGQGRRRPRAHGAER
jgi:predicted transcriptional regulator